MNTKLFTLAIVIAVMAGAIVMYDRVRCLGRFADRPVGEGGPAGAPGPIPGRKVGRGKS